LQQQQFLLLVLRGLVLFLEQLVLLVLRRLLVTCPGPATRR
jgi:hypothetical protein